MVGSITLGPRLVKEAMKGAGDVPTTVAAGRILAAGCLVDLM